MTDEASDEVDVAEPDAGARGAILPKVDPGQDAANKRIAAEFLAGYAAGRDPTNAHTSRDGVATTSLRSPWLHQLCPRCGHSFRRGDRVKIAPGQPPVHSDDTRYCSGDGSNDQKLDAVTEAYFAALNRANPHTARVTRLLPGDPALQPPAGKFGRKRCAVCGHTLRPFDEVVVCPCSPDNPRCWAMVHDDAVHQMPCLTDWQDRAGSPCCPVTAVKLE